MLVPPDALVRKTARDGTPGARFAQLAGEHDALLHHVGARVEALVGEKDRWPAQELRRLIDCLQQEVLRQVEREEQVIFPAASPSEVVQLARDHVRLRVGAQALELAAAGEGSQSAEQLRAHARGLLLLLQRHLETERRVFTQRP